MGSGYKYTVFGVYHVSIPVPPRSPQSSAYTWIAVVSMAFSVKGRSAIVTGAGSGMI